MLCIVESAEDEASLKVREDFSNHLSEYIRDSAIEHDLLTKMADILVSHKLL